MDNVEWTEGLGYNGNRYIYIVDDNELEHAVIEPLKNGGFLVREHLRESSGRHYPKPLAGPFDTLDEAKAAVLMLI